MKKSIQLLTATGLGLVTLVSSISLITSCKTNWEPIPTSSGLEISHIGNETKINGSDLTITPEVKLEGEVLDLADLPDNADISFALLAPVGGGAAQLPGWLSFAPATGVVSATRCEQTAALSYVISAKYTVTTEDDDGEEAEDIQTAVSNSFTITVSSAGTGILGFDITNNAITGVANAELEWEPKLTWGTAALPDGIQLKFTTTATLTAYNLTLDSNTGVIKGTPSSATGSDISIALTVETPAYSPYVASNTNPITTTLTLSVIEGTTFTTLYNSSTSLEMSVDEQVGFTPTVTFNGTTVLSGLSFSEVVVSPITTNLPGGLNLNLSTGAIAGTPTTATTGAVSAPIKTIYQKNPQLKISKNTAVSITVNEAAVSGDDADYKFDGNLNNIVYDASNGSDGFVWTAPAVVVDAGGSSSPFTPYNGDAFTVEYYLNKTLPQGLKLTVDEEGETNSAIITGTKECADTVETEYTLYAKVTSSAGGEPAYEVISSTFKITLNKSVPTPTVLTTITYNSNNTINLTNGTAISGGYDPSFTSITQTNYTIGYSVSDEDPLPTNLVLATTGTIGAITGTPTNYTAETTVNSVIVVTLTLSTNLYWTLVFLVNVSFSITPAADPAD